MHRPLARLQHVAQRRRLCPGHRQAPGPLHPCPGRRVLAPVGRVRRPPLLRPLGALLPVDGSGHRDEMPVVAEAVGELPFALYGPCPAAGTVGVGQRHQMVDVQLTRIRQGVAGVGVHPLPGIDTALSIVPVRDPHHALRCQHLLSRVLTVLIVVRPVSPIVPIVGRQVVRRFGDGQREVDGGHRRGDVEPVAACRGEQEQQGDEGRQEQWGEAVAERAPSPGVHAGIIPFRLAQLRRD